jgi:Asp-tRNA(Asn)/Glu-tRNA(Gln) amidotransferase A subunit family amidase
MKITKRALLHAGAAAALSKHLPISATTPVSGNPSDNTLTQAVNQAIARAEAGQALNAYVTLDAAGLHQQAQALAQRERAGEVMPLYGTVVALKDNIDVAGLPCGAGTRALQNRIPREDAPLVQRLRRAGALISGKLGMHELAFGITSNNAVNGAVHNPHDPARIPGGSSGGCGAAVAAGLVPLAIGTDTGGSVRIPASLCGVAGFRPSLGRYPARGIVPISSTRDVPGPLALSAAHLVTADAVMADRPQPVAPLGSLQGVRLGLPKQAFWQNLDPGTERVAQQAVETLARAGVKWVEVDLPDLATTNQAASFPIVFYEFVLDLGRYLQREGYNLTVADVIAAIESPDVAAACKPLLGSGAVPYAAYTKALAARQRLQRIYAQAYAAANVRALVFPTTPLPAAPIGQDDTVMLLGQQVPTFPTYIRHTDPGSVAGLCGISLPVGQASGLPVGLELDAPAQADDALLALAMAVEREFAPAQPVLQL